MLKTRMNKNCAESPHLFIDCPSPPNVSCCTHCRDLARIVNPDVTWRNGNIQIASLVQWVERLHSFREKHVIPDIGGMTFTRMREKETQEKRESLAGVLIQKGLYYHVWILIECFFLDFC